MNGWNSTYHISNGKVKVVDIQGRMAFVEPQQEDWKNIVRSAGWEVLEHIVNKYPPFLGFWIDKSFLGY